MATLVTVIFGITWMLVGFVALRWLGQRFFHEPRRAATFAAAVVLAFAAGTAWPFSSLRRFAAVVPAAPPAAPVAGAPALPGYDVGATCSQAHVSGSKVLGSLDVIGQVGKPGVYPGGFVADPGGSLLIVGWAASPDAKVAARAACLMIDGKLETRAKATYGISRPDVGTAYKTDALIPTGFTLTIPIKELARGLHRVTAVVVPTTGETAPLPSTATFSVP